MDGLIAYALAKKYTDKVGQDIISAGFKVQVEDNRSILNRQGEEKVLYLLPKEYGSDQDGYDEFVYANNAWEWIGKTDVSLDYNELENKPTVSIGGQTDTLSGALVFDNFEFVRTLFGNNGVALSNAIFKSFFEGYYTTPYDFAQLSEHYIHTGCFYELKNRAKNIPVEFSDATNGFYIFNFGEIYAPYEKFVRVVTYSTTSEIKTFIQFYSVDYNYEVTNASDWQQIGGAQIVSGVVNANGTITFTDSEGNSFTTSGESVIGPQGAPGQDYVLTAQDKTDIANIVLDELPTTEGVLYGNQSN